MAEPEGAVKGAATLTAASIVSALVGWLTLVVVARIGGPEEYASFSVVWSVYFAAAGILIGLQQETTRTLITAPPMGGRTSLVGACGLTVAGLLAVLGVALTLATGLSLVTWKEVWSFGGPTIAALPVLAAAMVATGILAAERRWGSLAAVTLGDQVVRFVGVACVVVLFPGTAAYGLALVLGLLWYVPHILRVLLDPPTLSYGRTRFSARAAAAMLAAGCANMLVVGLPFLITITGSAPERASGVLFAAILLTRTPILFIANAVRPVLVRTFVSERDRVAAWMSRMLPVLALLSAGAVTLGWWLGPWALRLLFGDEFATSRTTMAILVAGAILMLTQTCTGLILVAQDRDWPSTLGWVASLVVGVTCLAAPWALQERVLVALILAPVLGGVVHLVALGRGTTVQADCD